MRATQVPVVEVPDWPDLTGSGPDQVAAWRDWVRQVWGVPVVAEAVAHASPDLARQVDAVCGPQAMDGARVRRTVLALARYVLRMTGRSTPVGLMAGVGRAGFGGRAGCRDDEGQAVVARADGSWLAAVVDVLESCPEVVARVPLVVNNVCFVRGGHVVVPYQHRPAWQGQTAEAVDVTVRYTAAVKAVLEAARTPILGLRLVERVSAAVAGAAADRVVAMVVELVRRGVLVSALRAPSTVVDALGHLVQVLDEAGAAQVPEVRRIVATVADVDAGLRLHNRVADAGRLVELRKALAAQMDAVAGPVRQPLAVDLRLGLEVVLPRRVGREVELAASVLARVGPHPFGAAAWQEYHTRFFERYGIGAVVPLLDVVDPDVGLGWPAGYRGSTVDEPPAVVSARDLVLLGLVQAAALDGRDEVVVDDELVAELAHPDLRRARVPAHLELCVRVDAVSGEALDRGEFGLTVTGVSRGVGTMTGRFAAVLDDGGVAGVVAGLPVSDPRAVVAQVSYAPLDPATGHVARSPRLLPDVVSVGEHHDEADGVIGPRDLAVGCDSQRLYLVQLSTGRRLEPMVAHALDLRAHTAPLARFVAEIGRAQAAVVGSFDWGAAARLPWLPRVRYGRTVLCRARWLLDASDLPGRSEPWRVWVDAVEGWCGRRRVPDRVELGEGDQRLPLDLRQPGHLVLLRTHLDSVGRAVLTEAGDPAGRGWIGGRAHEVVVPLVADPVPVWPAVPPVTAARVIGRDHGHAPGVSRWLYVQLYGHVERQPEILGVHLPALLAQWETPPRWWYIRYRDAKGWHLRLRIEVGDFGAASGRVSGWAGGLRRLGLLRDLQFGVYYPEVGRWGGGAVMAAAEEVFGADSAALVAGFGLRDRPGRQVVTAAHLVSIASGWCGGPEDGMRWLVDHARTDTVADVPRPLLDEGVRLADPTDGWAALRAAPGGEAIVAAWQHRDRALADYRKVLANEAGVDPDTVLDSLLHAHYIRACGIDRDDERLCLRLARAAALARLARSGR
ncbi:lantibiotic dehydratase [Polymorphospora sp. NPDC050346]|uniref:lantibiotic dehydratase n=1 Tax=Polymorphospora sp. NPDC050346 TaxID=3155780 RepID=UPI00340177DB